MRLADIPILPAFHHISARPCDFWSCSRGPSCITKHRLGCHWASSYANQSSLGPSRCHRQHGNIDEESVQCEACQSLLCSHWQRHVVMPPKCFQMHCQCLSRWKTWQYSQTSPRTIPKSTHRRLSWRVPLTYSTCYGRSRLPDHRLSTVIEPVFRHWGFPFNMNRGDEKQPSSGPHPRGLVTSFFDHADAVAAIVRPRGKRSVSRCYA